MGDHLSGMRSMESPFAPSPTVRVYRLAAAGNSCDGTSVMSSVLPQPSTLKPDLIHRIESMSEEELQLVHEVLLHAEKDRLWREISTEAEEERRSGTWERLPEIIAEVRSQLRRA